MSDNIATTRTSIAEANNSHTSLETPCATTKNSYKIFAMGKPWVTAGRKAEGPLNADSLAAGNAKYANLIEFMRAHFIK